MSVAWHGRRTRSSWLQDFIGVLVVFASILRSRMRPEKPREDTHVEREQVLSGRLCPPRHPLDAAECVKDLLDAQLHAAGDLVSRARRPPGTRLYLAVLVAGKI